MDEGGETPHLKPTGQVKYDVPLVSYDTEYHRKMDKIRLFYLLTYPITQPIMWLMDRWRW